MSKKSNPVIIGAFVVGAIALLAVSLVLFGGAQYFKPKTEVSAYFEGSVKGLRVGSNVLFRGVRIGFVNDIQLIGITDTLHPMVRATLELTPGAWILYRDGKRIAAGSNIGIKQLVDAGLRAQLGTESLVTGQLVIELDFVPDIEPVMRAPSDEKLDEIPTIPTDIERAITKLQKFAEGIDFDRLQNNIQDSLEGIDALVNSQDIREALAGINRLANNPDLHKLPTELRGTLREISSAAQKLGALSANIDAEIDPLASELIDTLNQTESMLSTVESTLNTMNHQLGGDTKLIYDIGDTMTEVRDAARSLRTLTDYLQNYPEALIRGKPNVQGDINGN